MSQASLLFSVEVAGRVWAVGHLKPDASDQALELFPPKHGDGKPLWPQVALDLRGKLLFGLRWTDLGAKLELHSIRSLTVPTSRLYELRGLGSEVWTLQIWAVPPEGLGETTEIPVCKVEVSGLGIPFTAHSLKLERPVEIFWPQGWLHFRPSVLQPKALAPRSVALRCRHAMFEGATEDGVTARSLKHWAEMENWFLFGPSYSRYDDELLPIDEATALHPEGDFMLTQQDIRDLRQDDSYIFCHSTVVRFVLLSWGWDIDRKHWVDEDIVGGQGWSGHAWRLRHLCLSCWLLGQEGLRQACRDFVMALSDAPWAEDGYAEAVFTLGPGAQDFWATRDGLSFGSLLSEIMVGDNRSSYNLL